MDNTTLLNQHVKDKLTSTQAKERRFHQWNENYYLYRDKVLLNRLTQRQPVNIPIMRETIQTWISKIDEPPMLMFESRTKDNKSKDGEIILNELWGYYYDKLKLDLVDNLEKKVVGLQGRGFKKWGWSQGDIFCDLIDPYDIDIDPKANPLELNSARFLIHKNIFVPLRDILANPKYDDQAKNDLKVFLASEGGLIKAQEMRNEYEMREERMRVLGILNADNFDLFTSGETIVEINENYRMLWDASEKRFRRYLIKIAADKAVLYKKPMEDAIGIKMLPIVSWADDPDLNDNWPDGKGDSVRTINKVVNMYISQDLENRTYRNFGMYFFNTNNGKFKPRAFDPKPFGMYGVPGKPEDMIKQMNINPLADTAQQITFLKTLIQSSVAQTPTERGIGDDNAETLGEVKLNLKQSTGRNEVTAKNYRRAWKESGLIFYELLNANSSGVITLYKKGTDGEYRSKTVMPSDWKNPAGYECKVVLKAEKDAEDQFSLQKLQLVKQDFVNNPVAMKIARRKELELLDWTPEEIDEVMNYEDRQTTVDPTVPVDPNNPTAPITPTVDAGGGIKSPMQMPQIIKK